MGNAKLHKAKTLDTTLSVTEKDNIDALISDTQFYVSQEHTRSESNQSLPISDSIIPVTFDLDESSDEDEAEEDSDCPGTQIPTRIYSLGFDKDRKPDVLAFSISQTFIQDNRLAEDRTVLDTRDSSDDDYEESDEEETSDVEPSMRATSESPSVQGLIDAFAHVDLSHSHLKPDIISVPESALNNSPASLDTTGSFQKLKPDAVAVFIGRSSPKPIPVHTYKKDDGKTMESLVPLQTILRTRAYNYRRFPEHETPTPRSRRPASESVLRTPTTLNPEDMAPRGSTNLKLLPSGFAPYSSPFSTGHPPEFLPLGRVRRISNSYVGI